MQIKRTHIRREPWPRVIKRTQVFCETDGGAGAASLLRFDKLTEPLMKDYGDGNIIPIVYEGGCWLQYCKNGDDYFYTSVFDETGMFRQVYIDVTAGNVCNAADDAYFDDLFLDMVYTADEKIYILDRDELDEAVNDKTIDESVRSRVIELARAKIDELKNNGASLISSFIQLYKKLRSMM